MKREDWKLLRIARIVVYVISPLPVSADQWADRLNSKNPHEIREALIGLEKMAPLGAPVSREVGVLLARYATDEYYFSSEAVRVLSLLKANAAPVVPELIQVLKGPQVKYTVHGAGHWREGRGHDAHESAMTALAAIGPASKPALPLVTAYFKKYAAPSSSADVDRRDLALKVIGSMGPDAKDAVAVLSDSIKDTTPLRRWFHTNSADLVAEPFIPVFNAIEQIGPNGREALSNLKIYANPPYGGKTRLQALRAVAAIAPASPELLSIILHSLAQVDISQSWRAEDVSFACELLGRFPKSSKSEVSSAVETFKILVEKEGERVGVYDYINGPFCDFFVKNKESSVAAIPALAGIIKTYFKRRMTTGPYPIKIINALAEFGTDGKSAVPILVELIESPDFNWKEPREACVKTLLHIDRFAAEKALAVYSDKLKSVNQRPQ